MSARVRAVQERRRSNAGGPHNSRPTRGEVLAAALADYDDNNRGEEVTARTSVEDVVGPPSVDLEEGNGFARDLRPAVCENDEVCDWIGVVDDLDGDHDCPRCFEPTVRYDITPA